MAQNPFTAFKILSFPTGEALGLYSCKSRTPELLLLGSLSAKSEEEWLRYWQF